MFSIDKENYYWTDHVRQKMKQYRLSESRVKRVLRHPRRREVGVAENTIAGMQPAGSPKHPYEIWAMWSVARAPVREHSGRQVKKLVIDLNKKITIISVWRYPGISSVGEAPPIPEEVWEILKKAKY